MKYIIKDMSLMVKIAFIVFFSIMMMVLLTPLIAPYGETEIVGQAWEPISKAFILGTDDVGRDMFSRLLYGGRMSIFIAFCATLLSFCIGILFGFLVSFYNGWFDHLISRVVDILISMPAIIITLLVLSLFKSSIFVLIMISGILDSTRVFRMSRSLAMDICKSDYVQSSLLRGESKLWIMRRDILPNCSGVLLVEFCLRFCFQILFISGFSFLALGIQPPYADWGGIVRDNAAAISFGMIIPLYPALCIGMVTVCINFIAEWVVNLYNINIDEGM